MASSPSGPAAKFVLVARPFTEIGWLPAGPAGDPDLRVHSPTRWLCRSLSLPAGSEADPDDDPRFTSFQETALP
jgi:hypothetical protein